MYIRNKTHMCTCGMYPNMRIWKNVIYIYKTRFKRIIHMCILIQMCIYGIYTYMNVWEHIAYTYAYDCLHGSVRACVSVCVCMCVCVCVCVCVFALGVKITKCLQTQSNLTQKGRNTFQDVLTLMAVAA